MSRNFNRREGIHSNIKLNIGEILNLSNYIQFNNLSCNFKLIGVISYNNDTNLKSQYISYCRDPLFGHWYFYNDNIIKQVNNFDNEVKNSLICVLFYEKIN